MQPLRPALYQRLRDFANGHVKIANEGEEMIARYVKLANGKTEMRVDQGGEYYCISCPYCDDTRQRLEINYRWGLDDPKVKSKNLFLAHCFNEDCLAKPGRAQQLYGLVFSDFEHEGKDPVLAGVKPNPQSAKATWPGDCCLVNALPENHPARLYLVSRGYDVELLANRCTVKYCLEADSRVRFVQGRIIIPVFHNRNLVGWQARYVGDPPSKLPKYFSMPGWKKTHSLYNYDNARLHPFVCLCEGVSDVWRAGPASVALFGKTLSQEQKRLIVSTWGKGAAIVLLDADAENNARKVYDSLAGVHGRVLVRLPENKDPGDLDRAQLNQLILTAAGEQGVDLQAMLNQRQASQGVSGQNQEVPAG